LRRLKREGEKLSFLHLTVAGRGGRRLLQKEKEKKDKGTEIRSLKDEEAGKTSEMGLKEKRLS